MTMMKAVTVVRLGGKKFKPGDPIDVENEDVAAELEVSGAARKASKDDETSSDADRASAIAKAVEGLSDADWTTAGTPKVSAVEKAAGLKGIKADELNSFKKPEA